MNVRQPKICGCEAPYYARGLCQKHWARWALLRRTVDQRLPPSAALAWQPKIRRETLLALIPLAQPEPARFAAERICVRCASRFIARAPAQQYCDLGCFAAIHHRARST